LAGDAEVRRCSSDFELVLHGPSSQATGSPRIPHIEFSHVLFEPIAGQHLGDAIACIQTQWRANALQVEDGIIGTAEEPAHQGGRPTLAKQRRQAHTVLDVDLVPLDDLPGAVPPRPEAAPQVVQRTQTLILRHGGELAVTIGVGHGQPASRAASIS
jgi:hypothetical protein